MKNFILILFLFAQTALGQNLKLPQLNPILNSQLASNDLTLVSDITANESKKLSFGEMDKRWQWTATSPLLKTGSESAVLSIPMATTSTPGYLSSSDWTLFNAKQSTVSATSPVVFSSNTISIPAATASVHGYLSSNDWTTFNAKVGTSTAQVITNKDYNGGTASNTSRLTLPKDAKTNLDALTRKQGTLVYDTTSNKPYYDNGTALVVVGSGSGGSKNYVNGGDAESGTTGFATYADAAGTSPVDGTGGSASITWATSATTPLENLNSFIFTKGATNRQGDGVSYPFTIDAQDQAKVLNITFSYLVNSGTFVAGTSSTNSDVTVWIYDVTNAQIIQPSSYKLLSSSSTIADKFSATFQTASNSTSYRLIFHCATTSSSSFVLKVDSIAVSPSNYVYGTPITDWVSYTPTGSWSTNTTYSGYWRRVGKNLEYRIRLALAGAPTSASLTINYLPSGLSVDTANLPSTVTDGSTNIGQGVTKSAGTIYDVGVYYNGTGSAAPIVKNASSTYTGATSNITQILPGTYTSGDSVDVWGSVPILGWSSSVQMSDQADTRVVAMQVSSATPTATLTASMSLVKYTNTPASDSHGSFSTSTGGYTCPVSGYYRATAQVQISATYSNTQVASIGIGKNSTTTASFQGSQIAAGAQANLVPYVSGTILCNQGEVLYPLASTNGTTPTLASSAVSNYFYVERISGPNQIAATESVNARYYTAAGQSIPNTGATVVWGTKDYDSHGGMNTSTGVYTAPISGKYRVTVQITWASASIIVGAVRSAQLQKNGSTKSYIGLNYPLAATTTYIAVGGSDTVNLLAGDTISIYAGSGESSSRSLLNDGATNFITIERIGN